MASASDVLRIAAGEIGYSRWNDPETGTKYGRWYANKTGYTWYGANGVAYCAMFVSWVFDQAGQSAPGLPGAYCPTMLAKGGTVSKRNAQAGDIVYFDWGGDGVPDHVGIVEKNCGSYIQTIEGNTSSGNSGSQGNGGGVYRRTRNWSVVRAIVRPSYGASNHVSSSSSSNTSTTINTNATLDVDGYFGRNTVAKLQSVLGTYVDGIVSAQPLENKQYLAACSSTGAWNFTSKYGGGSPMIAALQNKIGTTPDGWFGPNSIKALQTYLGTTVDGTLDEGSSCVMELQRRLNAGTFLNGATTSTATTTTASTSSGISVDGWWGNETTTALQRKLGTTVDGIVSGQYSSNAKYMTRAGNGWEWNNGSGSPMIKALQNKIGASADGYIGQNTIKALQNYLGVSADGICGNDTVCALQNGLNGGKF